MCSNTQHIINIPVRMTAGDTTPLGSLPRREVRERTGLDDEHGL